MSAKLGGEIVTDADGFTRCGHEREYCHECYCDHRLYNDLQRKENKLGRPLTESENLEIHIKHELLHNNEVRDMFRARQPGAQGPLVLGSEEHKRLFDAIADACAVCRINGVALKACGSCRRTMYCGKECQRTHWKKGHKDECVPDESLRVPSDEAPTVAAALALAKPGATIILSAGTYDEELTLDKCVNIRGAGAVAGESASLADTTIMLKPLRVSSIASGALELQGIALCRGLILKSKTVQATVKRCAISNPGGSGIMKLDGSLTISDSSISTCEDGVLNQAGGLAVVRCQIEDCSKDGIFSNPHISVTDCNIRFVGRNGIKSRGGVTRLGNCDIQASQWDAMGNQGYGGMFRF